MAGQCFLVTGASGGIGAALVRHLAARDDRVILMARRAEPLESLAAELGENVLAAPGDVGSPIDIARAVSSGLARYGRIDGLAHCVGSIHLKPLHLTSLEEFAQAFHINVTTAFLACQAVLPELRKAKSGSVVLVSSVAAKQGLNNHEVIAAAKGSIEALVRSAAITYARWNIRFNAIAPGLIQTPMSAHLLSTDASRQFSEALHPLGRIGQPDDIAAAIAFLLGTDSPWITGQILGVDGGLSAGVSPPRTTART